jgi:hypothetical protein
MGKKPMGMKKEIDIGVKIVRSKTRDGLQTNIWNHLVRGYVYYNDNAEWYTDRKYWCAKMKKKSPTNNKTKPL